MNVGGAELAWGTAGAALFFVMIFAVGYAIEAFGMVEDPWHWFRHRWAKWSPPFEQRFRDVFHIVHGLRLPRSEPLEWSEQHQRRTCLTCGREEIRSVG
jgi:hypothetical protein